MAGQCTEPGQGVKPNLWRGGDLKTFLRFPRAFCRLFGGGAFFMSIFKMGLLGLGFSLLFVATPDAAPNNRFLVPGNDGYGIADCLAEGGDCGQAVADTYCEAQGFKAGALAYYRADEEITASTRTRRAARVSAYAIECRV